MPPKRNRSTLAITIDPTVRAKIEALAAQSGLPVSRWVEVELRKSIRAHEAEFGEIDVSE